MMKLTLLTTPLSSYAKAPFFTTPLPAMLTLTFEPRPFPDMLKLTFLITPLFAILKLTLLTTPLSSHAETDFIEPIFTTQPYRNWSLNYLGLGFFLESTDNYVDNQISDDEFDQDSFF
jgi:hypothetical protein